MTEITFKERLHKIFSTVTMTGSLMTLLADFQHILATQFDDMPKQEQRWVLKCYEMKLTEDFRLDNRHTFNGPTATNVSRIRRTLVR